jgi:murein tripeptide amidase MpaA
MMRRLTRRLLLGAAGAVALVTATLPGASLPKAHGTDPTLTVWRVPHAAPNGERLERAGLDVLEQRQGDDLFVLGDATTATQIRALGYRPTVAGTIKAGVGPSAAAPNATTYDGGYHTVEGQYAHLSSVASAHPDLATVVTYGQSWRKQQGSGGYALQAICLTHKVSGDCALNPNSTKPRFLLETQIHAREIATGEMSYNWIDYLVNNYGTNATVTSIMNSTELWVVPIVNPDGVSIVQSGGTRPLLQRKNADNSHGTCGGSSSATFQFGVDLNRNETVGWGADSNDPCAQTYQGPTVNSEPETTALEGLERNLFPNQRPAGGGAVPSTARGIAITLHSNAALNLLPWGYTNTHTPNDTQLRHVAAHFSSLNGYPYGQPGEVLYNASGDTDDFGYGQLGLAMFTIELGGSSFTPTYSYTTNTLWPSERQVFLYAAQIAGTPYQQ